MRAVAIIWVLSIHLFLGVTRDKYWPPCFDEDFMLSAAISWAKRGDMGVDLFLVLSGFLICYITMKEQIKHGFIDIWHFYRSRFLRIVPVIATLELVHGGIK